MFWERCPGLCMWGARSRRLKAWLHGTLQWVSVCEPKTHPGVLYSTFYSTDFTHTLTTLIHTIQVWGFVMQSLINKLNPDFVCSLGGEIRQCILISLQWPAKMHPTCFFIVCESVHIMAAVPVQTPKRPPLIFNCKGNFCQCTLCLNVRRIWGNLGLSISWICVSCNKIISVLISSRPPNRSCACTHVLLLAKIILPSAYHTSGVRQILCRGRTKFSTYSPFSHSTQKSRSHTVYLT